MRFQKWQSGNPSGRSKELPEFRQACRHHSAEALDILLRAVRSKQVTANDIKGGGGYSGLRLGLAVRLGRVVGRGWGQNRRAARGGQQGVAALMAKAKGEALPH